MPFDETFLNETIRVWQPYSQDPLTVEDAREIAENTVGFYGTLIRWAKEAKAAEASNGGGHA